jgi:protein TonB
MLSAATFSDWRPRLNQPIANSLLLSLSLHLLLLVLVQPAPGGGEERGTLVINARLAMPESMPKTIPKPPAETAAQPVVPPEKTPQPFLTSNVPSPAPPLPVPPTPAVSAPVSPPLPAATPATPAQAKPEGAFAAASPGGAMPHRVATAGASAPLGIGIDTTWYVARQVDVHARTIGTIVPDYPDEARRRNQEGTLKLMVKIDDLGRVRDVEVVEADLPGVFDAAALEAFRNARFQPAMKDGHPVRYQAYIRVVFKLRD